MVSEPPRFALVSFEDSLPLMRVDVCFTPRDLREVDLSARAVVVFDVLRATTTMTAALAAGVREIHIFDSLDAAKEAAGATDAPKVLCGERRCLRPEGFDLGNSPGGFTPAAHAGRTVFMCTTNGTRAMVAARGARALLGGALVNASAVAKALAALPLDTILLCAGTDGEAAMEDVLGAGAVAFALNRSPEMDARPIFSDAARIALRLFETGQDRLPMLLSQSLGGRNVMDAGLAADIDFAADLDALRAVPFADNEGRIIRNWSPN